MKLFIQEAAEQDILRQIEWYTDQGVPDVARRFRIATLAAIDALLRQPGAGSPKSLRNPQLSGLRSWQVKEFEKWRVYYLARDDVLTVVRILHGKRDIGALLEQQGVDMPDA